MLKKIIAIALALWIGASYIEICSKNMSRNPQYNEYNIIVNAVEFIEESGWAR